MTGVNSKPNISYLLTLGDSLSDRGTMNKRKLGGIFPMRYFTDLAVGSPTGRFTNGFVWGDYFAAAVAEDFEIQNVRRKFHLSHDAVSNAFISDVFIDQMMHKNHNHFFSLNNDRHVLYKGERFARYYCEGGLTSHDYFSRFTFNLKLLFSRLLLSTLGIKLTLLLNDDKKYKISKSEKAQTLVFEWSGANDFITVNSEPTYKAADKAVAARIKNIEHLVLNGYLNFVLFTLPDLSLTPRYQAKSQKLRDNAVKCCAYFNEQLTRKCQSLIKKYKHLHPAINLSVFDMNKLFKHAYENPEQYGLDRSKLTVPYTQSEEFKNNQKNPVNEQTHISPSKGFMFWDDVHSTSDVQAMLAERCLAQYKSQFNFYPPASRTIRSQEMEDIIRQPKESFQNNPHSEPNKPLPLDIRNLLNTIYANAQSMHSSKDPERRAKGNLLEQFVFDVKRQKGNLEGVHEYMVNFSHTPEHIKILHSHKNSFFDFFINKKATQSEDQIAILEQAVFLKLS